MAEACGVGESRIDTGGGAAGPAAIRRPLAELLPAEPAVEREYLAVLRGARQRFDELEASPALCHVADAAPADVLLIAAETWSPSEAGLFLVGVMFCQAGRLIVEQYVARDEGQEAGVCRALADRYAAAGSDGGREPVIVTFPGRRSQIKCLLDRCGHHGLALRNPAWDAPSGSRAGRRRPPHLDLRKECRRRWGQRLSPCSLATAERALLRRRPAGMIPRPAVAETYRDFLASGDASNIPDILRHNVLDLASMAQLLCLLLTGCEGPEE